jgi:hypothetical protein
MKFTKIFIAAFILSTASFSNQQIFGGGNVGSGGWRIKYVFLWHIKSIIRSLMDASIFEVAEVSIPNLQIIYRRLENEKDPQHIAIELTDKKLALNDKPKDAITCRKLKDGEQPSADIVTVGDQAMTIDMFCKGREKIVFNENAFGKQGTENSASSQQLSVHEVLHIEKGYSMKVDDDNGLQSQAIVEKAFEVRQAVADKKNGWTGEEPKSAPIAYLIPKRDIDWLNDGPSLTMYAGQSKWAAEPLASFPPDQYQCGLSKRLYSEIVSLKKDVRIPVLAINVESEMTYHQFDQKTFSHEVTVSLQTHHPHLYRVYCSRYYQFKNEIPSKVELSEIAKEISDAFSVQNP